MMVIAVSCGGKKNSSTGPVASAQPTSPAEPDPTDPAPIPPESGPDSSPPGNNLPPQTLSFKVSFDNLEMTESQVDRMNQASEIIKRVVSSDSFRDQIVNYTYNGVKRFVKNKGLSNENIYLAILDGAEKLTPVKDNTMSLSDQLYTAALPEKSYSYTNTLLIKINNTYFNSASNNELAARMVHHWLHKLGFNYKNTTSEAKRNSVPVAISRIVEEIGNSY